MAISPTRMAAVVLCARRGGPGCDFGGTRFASLTVGHAWQRPSLPLLPGLASHPQSRSPPWPTARPASPS
jgi:hypothetical protein